MKHVIFVIVALALPLAAQETQPVQQADSPLVAASKRMNRKGKKPANVITNDMLRQAGDAGGRVTTTVSQGTLNMPPRLPPPRPTPEMEAAASRSAREKDLAQKAAVKKAAAEEAQQKTARAVAAGEDGDEGVTGGDEAEQFVGSASPPQF